MLLALAACVGRPPETSSASADDARVVTFDELSGWPYVDGVQGMPESVKQLSGRRVAMTGQLMPVDGPEALLVASVKEWVPCNAPEINRIVLVRLAEPPTAGELKRWIEQDRRVKVTGVFTVGATVIDGNCVDIYQIRADRTEVVK